MEEPVVLMGGGYRGAVGAEWEFAASAHGAEKGTFGGGGEAGLGAIEGGDGGEDGGIAGGVVGIERVLRRAGFEGECALSGCGGELVEGEALVDGLGAAEAVEPGAGEDERVAGAFFELAKAGVDVAAELDELEIGAHGEELGAAAGADGSDASGVREGVEGPEGLADPGVAGVCARRDGGEGEARIELGGKIFERVDGEVDAPGGERFFNLLDKDAFSVETGGYLEAGLLHAVAGGADDFNFDCVALSAQGVCNVVCLPEGKLRTTRSNSDFCAHLNRIRQRVEKSVKVACLHKSS